MARQVVRNVAAPKTDGSRAAKRDVQGQQEIRGQGPVPVPFGFGAGLMAGTFIGIGTAALLGNAFAEINDQYKRQRDIDMPRCNALPPVEKRCINPDDCHETSDGKHVCFFTCPGKDEDACYY